MAAASWEWELPGGVSPGRGSRRRMWGFWGDFRGLPAELTLGFGGLWVENSADGFDLRPQDICGQLYFELS